MIKTRWHTGSRFQQGEFEQNRLYGSRCYCSWNYGICIYLIHKIYKQTEKEIADKENSR